MKVLLLFFALALSISVSAQEPQTGTPAACPIVIKSILTCIGPNQYKYYIKWQNPTSGAKSIKVMVGSCLVECIDATRSGEKTFIFSCSATNPTVVYYAYVGGKTCNGASCNSSLPIALLDFSGQRVGENVLLLWKIEPTSVEPTSFFEVQRSTDGRNFSTLQKRPASADTAQYRFVDTESKGKGKLFYRLLTDAGYSKTIPVFTGSAGTVTVAQGVIRAYNLEGTTMVISTMVGQEMKRVQITQQTTLISVDAFPHGLYIVSCRDNEGQQVVVQRFSK